MSEQLANRLNEISDRVGGHERSSITLSQAELNRFVREHPEGVFTVREKGEICGYFLLLHLNRYGVSSAFGGRVRGGRDITNDMAASSVSSARGAYVVTVMATSRRARAKVVRELLQTLKLGPPLVVFARAGSDNGLRVLKRRGFIELDPTCSLYYSLAGDGTTDRPRVDKGDQDWSGVSGMLSVYDDMTRHREVLYFQQVKYFTGVIVAILGLCAFLLSNRAAMDSNIRNSAVAGLLLFCGVLTAFTILVNRGFILYIDATVSKRKALEAYFQRVCADPQLGDAVNARTGSAHVRKRVEAYLWVLLVFLIGGAWLVFQVGPGQDSSRGSEEPPLPPVLEIPDEL